MSSQGKGMSEESMIDRRQRAAFLTGFLVSAEGWNGEYPYSCHLCDLDECSTFDFEECASEVLRYYSPAAIEHIMARLEKEAKHG